MDPKKKYDVAVLGWWYGKNYGSILTYYGLNRSIENLGHSVLMVHEPLGYNGYRVRWPEDMLPMKFAHRAGYEYTKQLHFSELQELNDAADTFVVGSDQLWNPLIGRVNDDLFLDFVADDRQRVAYGTSFGNKRTDIFKPEFVQRHSQNLKKFKSISVRENYAVDTAREVFGVKADMTVDPVFLLEAANYAELAANASIETSGEYLAVFFLDPTPEKKSTALDVMKKIGLEKIVVICNPEDGRKLAEDLWADEPCAHVIESDSPENFLRVYKDASYVVTDSFHGTAFAAIFEKAFSSIYNNKRGADRFKNLLTLLGFGDTRRVYENDTVETIANNANVTSEIDFGKARNYIQTGRETSLAWLRDALDPSIQASVALENAKVNGVETANRSIELNFAANSDVWAISKDKGFISLAVNGGGELRGKHVWTNLPNPLTPNSAYKIRIIWAPTTNVRKVNVHLRNPRSGEFVVVGSMDVKTSGNGFFESDIVFKPKSADFTQLMFGAISFTGKDAGLKVKDISIASAAPQELPPAPKKAIAAKGKQGTSFAVPQNTPDREKIVLNVLNNPRLHQIKADLLKINAALKIYIGRELKEYTHNKVGGPADILTFPSTIDELMQVVNFALEKDIPYTLLGRGSNVIVRDGGVRGIVIMSTGINHFALEDGAFTAGAGASFIDASYYLLEHGLSTLEWASGIPGTIGGAVYMNAGTNVSDIRSTIKSVKFIDHKGRLKELTKNEISWGKRFTTFHEHPNWIILEATFATKPSDRLELSKKMLATVQIRERHFPLEHPNHGSTFKWWRAPRLIMQAGLTGYQIGGVQISKKQPGFFINVNQATASDYEALINYAIAKVYEVSGFLLEPEVEFIGERPYRYERYSEASAVTNLERKSVGPQA